MKSVLNRTLWLSRDKDGSISISNYPMVWVKHLRMYVRRRTPKAWCFSMNGINNYAYHAPSEITESLISTISRIIHLDKGYQFRIYRYRTSKGYSWATCAGSTYYVNGKRL